MKSDQAHIEWLAWRQLCKELDAKGIDLNNDANDALARRIRYWGEQYRRLFEGTGDTYAQYPSDAQRVGVTEDTLP